MGKNAKASRRVKKAVRRVRAKGKKVEKRVKSALVKAGVPKAQVSRMAKNVKTSVRRAVRKQVHGAANAAERKINKGSRALAKVKSM